MENRGSEGVAAGRGHELRVSLSPYEHLLRREEITVVSDKCEAISSGLLGTARVSQPV